MRIWVDAQISPAIAHWITDHFDEVEAVPVRRLALRDAEDTEIFEAALQADAVVMTKDSDFVQLQDRLGAPPKVIWVTSGNTSNAQLREILATWLPAALALLRAGEDLVELGDR